MIVPNDNSNEETADDDAELERLATIYRWSIELEIPMEIIRNRLMEISGISGRDSGGRIRKYFPEYLIRSRCADILGNKERFVLEDDTYWLESDGIKLQFANKWNLPDILNSNGIPVSRSAVETVIQIHNLHGSMLQSLSGPLREYYSVILIEDLCRLYLSLSSEKQETEVDGRVAITAQGFANKRGIIIDSIWKSIRTTKIKRLPQFQANAYWEDELAKFYLNTNENGEVEIDGRIAISVIRYEKYRKLFPNTIANRIRRSSILPIPNVVGRGEGNKPVNLFWKDEIDRIVPHYTDERGVLTFNEREAVALIPYSKFRGLKSPQTLQKYVNEARLQPIPEIIALANSKPTDVYWRDEVDPLVPYRTNEKGEVSIDGRCAISLNAFATQIGIPFDSIVAHIKKAYLIAVPNIKVIAGKSKIIEVFWKDEVEAAIPKDLNEQGIITINEVEAVGLTRYGKNFGIANMTMAEWAKDAGLEPIPNIRIKSGVRDVKIYIRAEVDEILRKKGRL